MKYKSTPSSESSVFKLHNQKISKSSGHKKEKKLNGTIKNNLLKNEESSELSSSPSSIQSKRKEKQKKVQNKSEIDNFRGLKSSPTGPSKRKKNIIGANDGSPIATEADVLSNRRSKPKKMKRNSREENENLPVTKPNKKKSGNFDMRSTKEGGNAIIKSSPASSSVTDGSSPKKGKKKRSKKKGSNGKTDILQAEVYKTSENKTSQTGFETLGKDIVPEVKKIQKPKGQVETGSQKPNATRVSGVNGDQNSISKKQRREKFKNSKNSSLREKMLSRLSAARFRFINEELYTWDGQNAPKVFASDPKSFKAYHSGFKQQTKLWPINPIDVIIKSIKTVPGLEKKVIADFGCGEAKLALELSSNKVYSFDLIAINDRVTVCDNANTKLYSGSVDIAVHCLSLMSSNISGYIKEANRVLKIGGLLKIAEVESRFEDVEKFVENVCKFNFKLLKKDLSHNLFYFMDFEKVADIGVARKRKLPELSLQPCLYKKR